MAVRLMPCPLWHTFNAGGGSPDVCSNSRGNDGPPPSAGLHLLGSSERVLLVPQQAALHAQQCNECDCAALRRVSTGHRPHLQLQKVASKFV